MCCKQVMAAKSEELRIPVENLLTPDTLRHLCFNDLETITTESVSDFLLSLGARQWQTDLLSQELAQAILTAPDFVDIKINEPITD
jgi:ribonuclease D